VSCGREAAVAKEVSHLAAELLVVLVGGVGAGEDPVWGARMAARQGTMTWSRRMTMPAMVRAASSGTW
jgi:hypothetical protein